jgi:hypothetical protein
MLNFKSKRITLLVFSGFLIGLLMPPVEYVAVCLADYFLARFRQLFVNDGLALGNPWLSIVFVLVEMTTLFFLARFNRTLAVAALFTATAATVVLLVITSHIPDIS